MNVPNWKEWIKEKNKCKSWLDNYMKKGMLRKNRLTSQQYINKSKHNLDFANWVKQKHKDELPRLFGKERFYDWVISGYYYAIYHASLALIASKGHSSKSHYATLCAIIWYYHHESQKLEEKDLEILHQSIGKKEIEIITKTKELRERASYGVSGNFELGLVQQAKENTIVFLEKVQEILN